MTATDLLHAARQLSRDERIELVQAIWDSVAEDQAPPPLSDELRELLESRIASHEANPQNALTWDEIKRRVRARP